MKAARPVLRGLQPGNGLGLPAKATIIPDFAARHDFADMVVVADAGMLSASNLCELDDADLRFIVNSKATKAPRTWPLISAGTGLPRTTRSELESALW